MQLSHTRLVLVPVGWGSSLSTWSWSPAGSDGWGKSKGPGSVIPHIPGAQQDLKSSGLSGGQGGSILVIFGTGSRLGPAQMGGGDPGGCESNRAAEGQVFWHGVGPEAGARMAEGQVSHHEWVSCGVLVWRSPRGREPGRMEQQLCRTTGWEFGRLAVLLLDCGVEKPSTI
jgi:hypothetical protein